MNIVIDIVVYVLCAALWAVLLRYNLQMFQQNSNRPERYWRWFKSNIIPRPFCKSKVKFVWTKRIIRLAITSSLLAVLVCVLVPSCWAALLPVIFCWAFMLGGNLVNAPVEKAINKGYYRDAQKRLRQHPGLIVVGVTGSYGKTSTKNYLYRILSEKYNVLVTPGNFNTTLGVVRTIREQLTPVHQVFICEMGAKQVGDIKEICDLVHPTLGIVTAVGAMHLETFHSFENIQKTKFELIDSLPADGLGVINADSEGIRTYGGVRTDCRVERYSLSDLSSLRYSASGTDFSLDGVPFHTQLLGEGNILDILGALKIAKELGVSVQKQQIAVSKLQSVEHRLSRKLVGGLLVIDDAYNSNPEGARMAIDVMQKIEIEGRKIIVTPGFVELGERQQSECEKLGGACACADYLVIVNRYNREAILKGALAAGMDEQNILCVDTLAEAAGFVQSVARSGDAVLYENDLPDTFR